MRFHQQLIAAINERSELQIYYDGYIRVIEPFTYGINYLGQHVLRGYEITVEGVTEKAFRWKVFRTEQIAHLRKTGLRFRSVRPGYVKEALPMKRVYARF